MGLREDIDDNGVFLLGVAFVFFPFLLMIDWIVGVCCFLLLEWQH
jgi:hypothetical protein